MNPQSKEFGSWCFNQSIRIGQIIWVGCCGDGECCTEQMKDLIDESDDDELAKLFGQKTVPAYIKQGGFESDSERRSEILQFLIQRGCNGFVVTVERPVMRHKGKSKYYSWGYFHTERIYTPKLDESFVAQLEKVIAKMKRSDKKWLEEVAS